MDDRQIPHKEESAENSIEVEFTGSSEEIAARLGVTTAGLRRLADIYDTVHTPIRRDAKHNKRRVWTYEAIGRLERARRLVQEDRAKSIKAALEIARDGTETPRNALGKLPQGQMQDSLLLALLEHILRLEERVEQMHHQLEQPKGRTTRETELERMNTYLLGELERRRLVGERLYVTKNSKPWWKFWDSR